MQEEVIEALKSLEEATSKKYRWLSSNEIFKFACQKKLLCFTTCCRDVNIFLTPYDVLRIRQAIKISSNEFLEKYSILHLGNQGLPIVMLKMRENEKKECPFVSSQGCSIYNDRPWSCRIYPLAMASSRTEKEFYFILEKETSCLGFKERKKWTVHEWNNNQKMGMYDKMNKSYKEITLHPHFQNGKKLTPAQAKMFYKVCYNQDEFKKFLFETRFFDIYDVEDEVIEKIKKDEAELLNFGFRWIKFSLFWENTLKFKDKMLHELIQVKKNKIGLLW